MAEVKVRYYVVPRGKQSGYWIPNKAMRALGFRTIRCGKDGPLAWAVAEQWNARWDAVRAKREPSPAEIAAVKQPPDIAEAARVWPRGSIGDAFQRFLKTEEWRRKAPGTRQKIWWPAWFRIRDAWGDANPNCITFEMVSEWRSILEKRHSLDVAHKTIKVWRALWKVMRGMHIARGDDPSIGVRNIAPKPRHQCWNEGEAVRLVKEAWRSGYQGLACIVAVCWDTLFSPVDVRTLADRHMVRIDGRLVFDRSTEGRTKTGRAAYGTLSRRTERLVLAYLAEQGVVRTPDAILFRTQAGSPYRPDMLSHDFGRIRDRVFQSDKRQLRDMRRAGTVEIMAGAPDVGTVSAKLANSIERSNQLAKTYSPIDITQVQSADAARERGRKRLRAGTNRVEKVSTSGLKESQPMPRRGTKPLK